MQIIPISYPEKIDAIKLNIEHPEYQYWYPTWIKIDDLIKGGISMEDKKREYIVPRPGEDREIYELRLRKFVYTPLLGSIIKDYTTKLVSAPLHVEGAKGDWWDKFRQKVDGKNETEKGLLNKLFMQLLCFGTSYIFVDKPTSEYDFLNRAQEEIIGNSPWVNILSPFSVINWSENKNGDLEWAIIRYSRIKSLPLEKPIVENEWVIVDRYKIVRYFIDTETTIATKISEVEHGLGKLPVLKYKLSDELYTGNQAYLKALQYLQIENAWTDTATIAGYVQRVFTPLDQQPDDDFNNTYTSTDEYVESIKSGNSHILVGKSFEFNEINGGSLKTISESVLDAIETQIKNIVSLGNVSANKGILQQSGVSKGYDYSQIADSMRAYGQILVAAWQEVLQLVGESYSMPEWDKISVSGFDSFEVDALDDLLNKSEAIDKIADFLGDTALALWYKKIQAAMHRSASIYELEEMNKEIDILFEEMRNQDEKRSTENVKKDESDLDIDAFLSEMSA
jgi:hypothetical protein